jgi:hypothetical protein
MAIASMYCLHYNIVMGSGRNRKGNDQPLIRRPKKAVEGIGVGGIGVEDEVATIADKCPLTFQVEVIKSGFVMKGARLELIREGELYAYYISGHRVGILSKKMSETIITCVDMGIKYSGAVVEEKEKVYARFTRVA